jgi:hypothetical protein
MLSATKHLVAHRSDHHCHPERSEGSRRPSFCIIREVYPERNKRAQHDNVCQSRCRFIAHIADYEV